MHIFCILFVLYILYISYILCIWCIPYHSGRKYNHRFIFISTPKRFLYLRLELYALYMLYVLYSVHVVDIVGTVHILYHLTDLVYVAVAFAVPRLGSGPSKIRVEGTHLPMAPARPPILRPIRQLPHRDRAALPTVQCQGYQGMSECHVLVKTLGESCQGYETMIMVTTGLSKA